MLRFENVETNLENYVFLNGKRMTRIKQQLRFIILTSVSNLSLFISVSLASAPIINFTLSLTKSLSFSVGKSLSYKNNKYST